MLRARNMPIQHFYFTSFLLPHSYCRLDPKQFIQTDDNIFLLNVCPLRRRKIIPHGAYKVFKLNRRILYAITMYGLIQNEILLRHKNNFRVINQSSCSRNTE